MTMILNEPPLIEGVGLRFSAMLDGVQRTRSSCFSRRPVRLLEYCRHQSLRSTSATPFFMS